MNEMRSALLFFGIGLARLAWGQAGCASCHREIAESYARTGMGRSFQPAGRATLPEFNGSSFDHALSRVRFTAERRDGRYFVNQTAVDYLIGSGRLARSYLHRTAGSRLVELPVTWYAENGGHWGMSRAYDRSDHPGFTREISYRCMFCHNGYPEVAERDAQWEGATIFPAKLPEGIDCERCHGPGGGHARAASAGRPAPEVRAAIVNPARLSAERQLEVCMQCHLETTSMSLPGAVMRFDRGVFSYRPGEPLGDYMVYFDHAPGTGHENKFELAGAAYRLRQSACFRGSSGRLTCTTCHDPHGQAGPAKAVSACRTCHSQKVTRLASEGRHPAGSDCIACHMPRRQAEDAIHIRVTDHSILRKPSGSSSVVERHDGNTLPYAGEVALYYPPNLPPTAANELLLAVAQVKQLANLPSGLVRLEKAIGASRPASARPYFELAQALFDTGQAGRALPYYQEAAQRDRAEWRYQYSLGYAWQAAGQTTRALSFFERARRLAPAEPGPSFAIAYGFAEQGHFPSAEEAVRQAIGLDPGNPLAWSNLGDVLLRSGDAAGAEDALREAVRLRPESAATRVALAGVLTLTGKWRESRAQWEEAVRIGPATEPARLAWARALASGRGASEARSAYEASLRAQSAGMHEGLATALLSMGDAGGAIREYRLVLEYDPQSATAHLKLGELLLKAGEAGPAAEHLKRAAASSEPSVREAAERLLRGR